MMISFPTPLFFRYHLPLKRWLVYIDSLTISLMCAEELSLLPHIHSYTPTLALQIYQLIQSHSQTMIIWGSILYTFTCMSSTIPVIGGYSLCSGRASEVQNVDI
jgi:hypothetical protein